MAYLGICWYRLSAISSHIILFKYLKIACICSYSQLTALDSHMYNERIIIDFQQECEYELGHSQELSQEGGSTRKRQKKASIVATP